VAGNTKITTDKLSSPRRQSKTETTLTREYHEIGIKAVAAAARYQGRRENAAFSRAPPPRRSGQRIVNDTD
jgi:hypothetical protein